MFRSAQSMLKVEVVNNTFCSYLFEIHDIVFWNWNVETTSLSSTHYICAGSETKGDKVQRAVYQCVFGEARLSLMSMHSVLFFCAYSVYRGQTSPNVQHLV
jgi:hypothetical protein